MLYSVGLNPGLRRKKILSDDEVIQSVRQGRTQDFEILVERYKKRIINFVNKMIYDYDESQSISQDVFLKVFESLKQYRMQDTFSAFIFTVAKNMTFNYLKRRKRVVLFSSFLSKNAENRYFRTDHDPARAAQEDQVEERVLSALRQLKDDQRLALVLKVYNDYSYQQIVAITGWTVPKIETLISRARDNLKNILLMQEKGDSPV